MIESPVHGDQATLQALCWKDWLPTVDLTSATQEQVAVLQVSHPQAKTSDYYLTLAPASLTANHIHAPRDQGLDDAQVPDLIHAISIFAWTNRLMLNLGGVFSTS